MGTSGYKVAKEAEPEDHVHNVILVIDGLADAIKVPAQRLLCVNKISITAYWLSLSLILELVPMTTSCTTGSTRCSVFLSGL